MDFVFRPFPKDISEEECRGLAAQLNVSPAAARLLCLRGITDMKEAERFLQPRLEQLPSPFLMKGMNKGVDLLLGAIREKRQVLVYGDYDVDGICATALLADFLTECGLEVTTVLPDRIRHGYGLSVPVLEKVRGSLGEWPILITVDNGISAEDEVRGARELGFQVIVTDHHRPGKSLPLCEAVIDPHQEGCGFPQAELSGAGVALYLCMGLRARLTALNFWQDSLVPNLKEKMDLVALGTVADVMPVTGVNRILVKAGLEVLSSRKRPGIQALCHVSGMEQGEITAEDIGFRLAPRINAAGRLGSAEIALRLLRARKTEKAFALAAELERLNQKRRNMEEDILVKANKLAQEQRQKGHGLVVYDGGWHIGLMGIIASRLNAMTGQPVMALCDDPSNKEMLRGSGRGCRDINLYEIISNCSTYLEKFGGHAEAVGIGLRKKNLRAFSSAFRHQVKKKVQDSNLTVKGSLLVDILLEGPDMQDHGSIVKFLRYLQPYGNGNPEPVFMIRKQRLDQVQLVRDAHIRFSLVIAGNKYQGIGFNLKERHDMARHSQVDIAFHFRRNCYRGRSKMQIHALNISPSN